MPIETGDTISQLDSLWPLSGDPMQEGDNHLRIIKAILKAQFPGELGAGFAKVIVATENELNYLSGVTSSIQDQFDALSQKITDDANAKHPVSSLLFTENPANPSTYGYPGVWTLQSAGSTIKTSAAGSQGVTEGSDTVDVPVPHHGHSAAFTGAPLDVHKHDSGAGIREGSHGGAFPYGSAGTDPEPHRGWEHGKHTSTRPYTDSVSAGTPAGEVTVTETGTPSATINVAGKTYTVLVWKRTS